MYDKKIKGLFILIAVLLFIGFGITLAYFTSSTDFENEFQTGLYQTEATETFVSPQNWLPGDTTPKTLTVTNTGNVDVKARVCISEEWESANGDTLSNEVNNERVAIINLANTSDWTFKNNCYEYNDVLEPDDITSSFIESVTFNSNATADITCTTTTQNGSTTKTCTSSGDGYDNATYTLTFTVETVQANKASELWNTIKFVNRQNQNSITVGDEIRIGSEHFYIVSSDSNKTSVLAKYNLLVGDIFDYDDDTGYVTYVKTLSSSDTGYGLQNSEAKGWVDLESGETIARYVGSVPFSGINYWGGRQCGYTNGHWGCTGTEGLLPEYAINGASYSGSPYPNVYRSNMNEEAVLMQYAQYPPYHVENNGYTIAYFVEQYKDRLNELGAPNTIVARLLTEEEAVSLGCDDYYAYCKGFSSTAPTWLYTGTYWLGSAWMDNIVWNIRTDGKMELDYTYSNYESMGVRPVIEIPTSELN